MTVLIARTPDPTDNDVLLYFEIHKENKKKPFRIAGEKDGEMIRWEIYDIVYQFDFGATNLKTVGNYQWKNGVRDPLSWLGCEWVIPIIENARKTEDTGSTVEEILRIFETQYSSKVIWDYKPPAKEKNNAATKAAEEKDPQKKYEVATYDNHDRDSNPLHSGYFPTEKQAITHAKRCVDDFLKETRKATMTSEELFRQYTHFAEEPVIIPRCDFSARKYAENRCRTLCQGIKNQPEHWKEPKTLSRRTIAEQTITTGKPKSTTAAKAGKRPRRGYAVLVQGREWDRFPNKKSAIARAKELVDGYLEGAVNPSMKAEVLYSHYVQKGLHPTIASDSASVLFDALKYARERCKKLCAGNRMTDKLVSEARKILRTIPRKYQKDVAWMRKEMKSKGKTKEEIDVGIADWFKRFSGS